LLIICLFQKEKANVVQRRGAGLALRAIVNNIGDRLPEVLPLLWASIIPTSADIPIPDVIINLQVLEVIVPALPASLLDQVTRQNTKKFKTDITGKKLNWNETRALIYIKYGQYLSARINIRHRVVISYRKKTFDIIYIIVRVAFSFN